MTDKLRAAAKAALETLDILSKLGNGDVDGNSKGNEIAQDARQNLRAALAEPEQEPVACIGTNGGLMWLKKPSAIYSKPRPLYAAPPRREWVGLTGTELEEIFANCDLDERGAVAHMVEVKLRNKNT